MDKDPKVSVLTAVYNGEPYIAQAIESILAQTYKDFEYIIIENNSTDKTPKILDDYVKKDTRIKVIHEKEPGPAHARNAGLKIARGEWIAILDADDIALPRRLELQLEHVQKKPDICLLGSDCIVIDKNGHAIKKCHYPRSHTMLLDRLENLVSFFPHSSSLFKKESMLKLNGYSERFAPSEDRELCLRLSTYGTFACIDEPLIKLRKHSEGISNIRRGRVPIVLPMAALICYYRRKNGLFDPSAFLEKEWERFLGWIEIQLEELDFFRQFEAIRLMREIWYSKSRTFFSRSLGLFHHLLCEESSRAVLMKGIRFKEKAIELAKKSKSLFF